MRLLYAGETGEKGAGPVLADQTATYRIGIFTLERRQALPVGFMLALTSNSEITER